MLNTQTIRDTLALERKVYGASLSSSFDNVVQRVNKCPESIYTLYCGAELMAFAYAYPITRDMQKTIRLCSEVLWYDNVTATDIDCKSNTVYVQSLIVDPMYQKCGLGSTLLQMICSKYPNKNMIACVTTEAGQALAENFNLRPIGGYYYSNN